MTKTKTIKLYHHDGWGYEIESYEDGVEIRYYDSMEGRDSKKPDDKFVIPAVRGVLHNFAEALTELADEADA